MKGKIIVFLQFILIMILLVVNIEIFLQNRALSSTFQRPPKDTIIKEITHFSPILDDYPQFVSPVKPDRKFFGTPFVLDYNGNLEVIAWYYSYLAGGVIESKNLLNIEKTAIIVVHSDTIHNLNLDSDFQLGERGQVYLDHIKIVINPFLLHYGNKVKLVAYSMQDYMEMTGVFNVAERDVFFYDKYGYESFKKFLKSNEITNILLCGYTTDASFNDTMSGYENLRKDFNVFIVGDATLSDFPASMCPAGPTSIALANAALDNLITQVSWIKETK
ncbi:MAG: isochorismatase family protein [Bacillota bacterium]|nr:isochorismatase family protein [Bacillota bacterium]